MLSRDALHVHVGLAVFLSFLLVFRRRWAALAGWLILLAAAIYGEYLDHQFDAPANYAITEPEHYKDIANTMFWPTLLLIAALFWLGRTPASKNTEESGEQLDQPLE